MTMTALLQIGQMLCESLKRAPDFVHIPGLAAFPVPVAPQVVVSDTEPGRQR